MAQKIITCYLSLLKSYATTKKGLLEHLTMYFGTVIGTNKILDVILDDDPDAGIDSGYENNRYSEVMGYDKLNQQQQ